MSPEKKNYPTLKFIFLITTLQLMYTLVIISQIVIAVSIIIVWVFRFDNIVVEFKQYGISDTVRNMVGATKIALSTLLIAGIWYPDLVAIPALIMAFLMVCAQVAHFKVKNPWQKHMPSLFLLLLSLFVAGYYTKILDF